MNEEDNKLEEISLAFANDELIKNPLSEYSNEFRIKLNSFCSNVKDISVKIKLSANLRVPVYLVQIEGTFENVRGVLDNLTKNDLTPYFYYAPPDLLDKLLAGGKTGTTKLASNYYKSLLKEKGYGVYKSDLWLAGNYEIFKRED